MGKQLIPPPSGHVEEIALREALEKRYLAYALSTIMHRALPDARDGLKPVHRRILYGMHLLRLDPAAAFKKSAKIVGDVMGSFHPHGDQAIYDALVRLAQDFASRYPLVDGQGNFGNIDGDNAAAYRYTEARMTEVARLLLDGIDEDAIDFRPTYDGSSQEPVVLPGAFPNLLANGAQGIAVGMATSIPPHNAAELCDAALHLIDNPNARSRTLLKYVPGPDFPTGGIIVDPREVDRGGLCDRARLLPGARPLAQGGDRTRHLCRRHYRDSVAGAEIAAGREDRRAAQRAQAAVRRRRARRVGRGHPPGDRAEVAHGRRRSADGIPVQADRAGKPHSAQHERAGEGAHPQGGEPGGGAHRVARPSPRGAGAAREFPPVPDRSSGRGAGRLSGGLSQPRQGHQDHPQRGRAQAGPDQDLQAVRCAGGRHPQHAAAQPAQARGDGDPAGGQGFARRAQGAQGPDRLGKGAVEADCRGDQGDPRQVRSQDAARQAPYRVCGGPRARPCGHGGGAGRARADHHRGFREGLDPRPQRAP